jgi:hypothetical protein
VSLVDWETGKPNARFWVLKLLRESFGPGDRLVRTAQPGPIVYAQAFVTRDHHRRLLLVNRRNRAIDIEVPQASGATMRFVDQTTGFEPPAAVKPAADGIRLNGYAVAVIEFAETGAQKPSPALTKPAR